MQYPGLDYGFDSNNLEFTVAYYPNKRGVGGSRTFSDVIFSFVVPVGPNDFGVILFVMCSTVVRASYDCNKTTL